MDIAEHLNRELNRLDARVHGLRAEIAMQYGAGYRYAWAHTPDRAKQVAAERKRLYWQYRDIDAIILHGNRS